MFSLAGRHALLAGLGTTLFVSGHSAFPGQSGFNELSGGLYARKALSLGSAADGKRVISAIPVLDVPARSSLAYIGLWTTLAVGTGVFLGYVSPMNGREWVPRVLPDNLTWVSPGHDLANGQRVAILQAATETIGYVVNVNGHTYQIAATAGGSPLSFPPSFFADMDDVRVVRNVVHTYEAAGRFAVSAFTVDMGGGTVNIPPAWNQGVTQITMTVGQTFDLKTLATDADLDPLTFSVDPTGTPLTGATLSSTGILTATSAVDLTGVRFIADDLR